jgi:acetyltransferase-like isoleucine patch superfamily enzyme
VSAQLLRLCGAQVGQRTRIKRSLFLDNTVESSTCAGDFSNLRIGRNCYVGDLVYLDLSADIQVENDAVISEGVSILTHSDCNRSTELARFFPRKTGAVTVGAGAWLGARSIVLSGIEIGECSVVAAGSVVTSSVEPWSVVAGAPARKIRSLERPVAPVSPP